MGDGKEVNLFNHFFITDEPDVEKRRKKKSSNGDDQNRENSGENSSKNLEKEQERYDDTEDRLKAEREYWENHRKWLVSGRDNEEESFLQWVMNGKTDDMAKVNKLVPPRHWYCEDPLAQYNVDDEGHPGSKANFHAWVRNGRNDDRHPTTVLAKVIPPSRKEALLQRINDGSTPQYGNSDRDYINWVTNGVREDERHCRKKLFQHQLEYDSDPEDNPYVVEGRQARP